MHTPRHHSRRIAAALLVAVALGACRSAPGARGADVPPTPAPGGAGASTTSTTASAAAIAQARADSVRRPYTQADVHFMTVMIPHHAQALEMARLAPTHGASPAIRTLAARIINAQEGEIGTMQQWLREREKPLPVIRPTLAPAGPAAGATGGHGAHHGAQPAQPAQAATPADAHAAHAADHANMPGMLTPAQMRELDQARGPEFDRLFLTYMIQHHRGAMAMVSQLFGSYGAGQDEIVFKFASDVNVDQKTEIARMERMRFELDIQRPASP